MKSFLLVRIFCLLISVFSLSISSNAYAMSEDEAYEVLSASYRHRYGVFIRLDLCTGLRMGELLALKWEDIDTRSSSFEDKSQAV